MTAKKRVTIKDVAARAGVSYQTVSRVINNKAEVSAATREKVLHVIDALNYRPNQAARSLSRRRSHIIGLIISYEADYLFRDSNLLAQISGIDAEANTHDYNLLLSTAVGSESGLEAYERFIRNQVADGALVIETASGRQGNKLLAQYGYPYVILGHNVGQEAAYTVHSNDCDSARALTHHLLRQGHCHIGVINGPDIGVFVATEERLRGYQQALTEANLPFDPNLVVYGDYTQRSGQAATEQLLAQSEKPTAIFAFNDRMAMGAVRALQAAGLQVPTDVAVVGFDDIPAAADFQPPLTTVRLPGKEMGQRATRMLLNLIQGEMVPEKEVVLPAEVIIRQSS